MRHPVEHAEHELKYGCLKVAVIFLGGMLFLFWPLTIGMTTDASGTEHVPWWAWLIEVPWLIIAVGIIGVIAARRRRS